jgi:TP901 family phage tail tape measure protein
MAAGRFSVEAVFKAIDKITAPVSRMQNRIGKFTRKVGNDLKRLNKQTQFLGKSFRTALGVAGIAGGLFLMQSAMASTIQTGVEFEQTLTNAAAKFPDGIRKGTAAFKQLEDAALQVGKTTEFTASQAAGGLNFLAMAGFNAEQSVAALPAVVDLATASQVDLATASDIATDSLGAFGLATKDAGQLSKNLGRINDVLAKTVTTANTDMTQLFETIKEGAPVATSAGQSLETFAAFAGTMANAGIKGGTAGTTLKNIMVRLTTASGSAAKSLKKMGVTIQDSEGNMRDVVDIFGDLEKGLDGLGTAQRSAVLENIFGRIPLAGVNVLLKTGSSRLREYRTELENSTGAAAEMAAVMRDTLRGQINTLKSATEGLSLTLFTAFAPALTNGVEKLTEIVRAVDAFLSVNRNTIPVLMEMIGNLLKVVAVFGAVKLAIIGVNLAMAVTPFGLIVAGLSLLIALLPVLIRNWDKVKETMRAVAFFWGEVFAKGIELAKKGLQGLIKILRNTTLVRGIELFAGIAKIAFRGIGSALGVGGPEAAPESDQEREVISPQERMVRRIETSSSISKTELRIKDETGRGELEGAPSPGVRFAIAESGTF